jgi:hypothetical protein
LVPSLLFSPLAWLRLALRGGAGGGVGGWCAQGRAWTSQQPAAGSRPALSFQSPGGRNPDISSLASQHPACQPSTPPARLAGTRPAWCSSAPPAQQARPTPVGHLVVQREAVVGHHEVDAVVGLAPVGVVQVGAAGDARGKRALHACGSRGARRRGRGSAGGQQAGWERQWRSARAGASGSSWPLGAWALPLAGPAGAQSQQGPGALPPAGPARPQAAPPARPPASPLMKRRTSSRYLPFHSAQTSQLGKLPTCGDRGVGVGVGVSLARGQD